MIGANHNEIEAPHGRVPRLSPCSRRRVGSFTGILSLPLQSSVYPLPLPFIHAHTHTHSQTHAMGARHGYHALLPPAPATAPHTGPARWLGIKLMPVIAPRFVERITVPKTFLYHKEFVFFAQDRGWVPRGQYWVYMLDKDHNGEADDGDAELMEPDDFAYMPGKGDTWHFRFVRSENAAIRYCVTITGVNNLGEFEVRQVADASGWAALVKRVPVDMLKCFEDLGRFAQLEGLLPCGEYFVDRLGADGKVAGALQPHAALPTFVSREVLSVQLRQVKHSASCYRFDIGLNL